MKYTNKTGLPQPIYDAVCADPYSRGDADISVTSLLKPPRVTALEHAHADEIEEDASERIYSLVGQVMHGILERANTTGTAERRLSIEVEGWKISGGMDAHYDTGLLQDYKFVTAYKFRDGGVPKEYEEQLNCYAEILRQHATLVNQLQIVAILRDWSKMEAARDNSYPQRQVIVRDVRLWHPVQAQAFLAERVRLHKAARIVLPECSKEERWARPDVFAVMKTGNKRAVKLFDDKAGAEALAYEKPGHSVVHRKGESIRCQNYCLAAPFCVQRQTLEAGLVESSETNEAATQETA